MNQLEPAQYTPFPQTDLEHLSIYFASSHAFVHTTQQEGEFAGASSPIVSFLRLYALGFIGSRAVCCRFKRIENMKLSIFWLACFVWMQRRVQTANLVVCP
jgi:hypothetical protein